MEPCEDVSMTIRGRPAAGSQPSDLPRLDGEMASVERRCIDVARIATLSPSARVALPTMIDRIASLFDPIGIVLFGSQARGGANDESDVDLLVVVPDGTGRREVAAAMYRAVRGLGVSKDILVATPSQISRERLLPGMTIECAMREGITVYEKSDAALAV
jgi:uncharacterized protein